MKVCVPTQQDKGSNSVPYGHFGSAPYFIIHDTDKGTTKLIHNINQHHAHGSCHPMTALEGECIEAIVVGGIGKRAIERLNTMDIRVYQSVPGTVQDNVNALVNGALSELTLQNACGGHSHT